jgi:Cu/Ag efflux protein CusF
MEFMKIQDVIKTLVLTGVLCLTNAKAETNTKSAKSNQGEYITAGSTSEVKSKVKDIDYKTRKVTLKADNGEEVSFIAGDNIKNLNQVKKGDTVIADYAEAMIFEIKKGGKAVAPSATEMTQSSRPGSTPQGVTARQVTSTVLITDIDKKKPSVTFKTADGEKETFKVRYPERLEGVKVGDTVNVTYTEALALKVEKATK